MGCDFSVVLLYCATSAIIVGLALWLGKFLRPNLPNAEKSSIYESGEKPIGSAWFNFNPRFYLVALVFVVFEVEIALTFPVVVVYRAWVNAGASFAWVAFLEILIFTVILVVGLAWAWAHGDLDWVKELRADAPTRPDAPPAPTPDRQAA
jgi:NADH-quinone oxidoreductase subunit A